MGHKKADERETVIKWLKECDRIQKEPWLWDFKNCYTDSLPEDSITALLEYKNGEFKDNTSDFNITKNTGFNADCDKEAIGLYQVLGWQNSATDVIRGETMNSFLTNFYCAIGYRPKDKKPRPSRDYLSKNYAKFDVISNTHSYNWQLHCPPTLDEYWTYRLLRRLLGHHSLIASRMATSYKPNFRSLGQFY